MTTPSADVLSRAALTALGVPIVGSYRYEAINYIDPTPQKIEVQIPLVEYFERIKKVRADRWQTHFCEYLQNAVVNRNEYPTLAEFHAQAQLGKTVILSQAFPAWCFGHDALFRYILAMYNMSRSESHTEVVIQIMRSKMHRDIFPSKDGHVPNVASKSGFMTNARRDIEGGKMDAQKSMSPIGLESGMTGSGFDWLTIDDPYKEPKDAFSETNFENLSRFWEYGVVPRMGAHSCVAAMFHRYNYDDFGGYLLNTGQFDYVRYASEADGVYLHEETGQRFEDPLGRAIGELISPDRFNASYYENKRRDEKVWLSMFQGRPGKEEGEYFQVNKIGTATRAEFEACVLRGRGWDHAATEGAGDRSAGGLVGIEANGDLIVADMFSEQIDSGARVAKQKDIAHEDGHSVTVVIPEDKSASGKDVVFFMQQQLEGFNVVARPVTNATPGSTAKHRRAHNLSVMVNTGRVRFVPGDWVDAVKRKMRRFGNSLSGDDEIDAISDVSNWLNEQFYKGLVIKNFRPSSNLVTWDRFGVVFGNGKPVDKIPAHWTVYAGVMVSPDASRPNSVAIVARAAQNSRLDDTLFLVAEYKAWSDDAEAAFDWLKLALECYCSKPKAAIIWLHPDSIAYKQTIWHRLKIPVSLFEGDRSAGVSELNWYLKERDETVSLFDTAQKATGFYGLLSDAGQLGNAKNEYGLASLRQEFATWTFDPRHANEPNKIGAVAECVRMVCHAFRTTAADLTPEEKIEEALRPQHRMDAIEQMPDGREKDEVLARRMVDLKGVKETMSRPVGRGWRRR